MSTVLEPIHIEDPLESIPTLPEEPLVRREVLLKAAELIERYGWTRRFLGSPDYGFCILGATATAAGHYDGDSDNGWIGTTDEEFQDRANQSLQILFGEEADSARQTLSYVHGQGIDAPAWNDSLEGHWGHVRALAALRRLANGATWKDAIS